MVRVKRFSSDRARRMTESEGIALVREWRESGLSMSEFCRVRGVLIHRLRYWKRRTGGLEEASDSTGKFVVLSANPVDASSASAGHGPEEMLEIHVGDRCTVRVPRMAGTLAEIVRALAEVER